MPTLYFLGGESIEKRSAEDVNRRAFRDAGGYPEVLVFPWTRKREQKRYRKIISDYFTDIGASKVIFAGLSDSKSIIFEKINSSSVIYLPGGDPRILLRKLRVKGVDRLLHEFKGVSKTTSRGPVGAQTGGMTTLAN